MKALLYILICFGLFSCVTQEKCLQKFPPQTTTETETVIEYRDTILQGATIEKVVKKDSLIFLSGETKTYVDTSGLAELTFYRNEYGEVVAKCEAKQRRIEKLIKEKSKTEVIEKVHEKEVRYIPWWVIAALSVTTLFAIPTLWQFIRKIILKF